MGRTSRAVMSCLAMVLLLIVALGSHAASTRNFQAIVDSGELRVGLSLFKPWVMKAENGVYMGFEADMARRLADDMGLELKFVEEEWGELIPALKSGRVDIIISGMTITPSRAMQVNFSHSYGESGIGLASHRDKTKDIKTMADLQKADIKIAAVAGSSAEELSKRLFKAASLKLFYKFEEAANALTSGKVHALVGPTAELSFLTLRHPQTIDQPLSKPLLNAFEAFAVRKGDYDFINYLNAWILARQADAWLNSTRYYWFNTLRWQELVK